MPDIPGTPQLVSQSRTSITISWSAPSSDGGSPITAYEILWNGGSGSTFISIATHTDLENLQYTRDAGLEAGTVYEFKVVAVNEVGPSLETASVAIKAA